MCVEQGYHNVNSFIFFCLFFFSSRRRHTRLRRDWSSDVCSSDLITNPDTVTLDNRTGDNISCRGMTLNCGHQELAHDFTVAHDLQGGILYNAEVVASGHGDKSERCVNAAHAGPQFGIGTSRDAPVDSLAHIGKGAINASPLRFKISLLGFALGDVQFDLCEITLELGELRKDLIDVPELFDALFLGGDFRSLGLGFGFLGLHLRREVSVLRSEERRVGKECRSRWSPSH